MRHILIKKKVNHNVNRPIVHFVSYFLLGIIGGNIILSKDYVSLFYFIVMSIIIAIIYIYYYGIKRLLLLLSGFVIGGSILCGSIVNQEHLGTKEDITFMIEGKVDEVSQTNYSQWIILGDVYERENGYSYKGKVQLKLPLGHLVTPFDHLCVKVKRIPQEPPMNPSDFNYSLYLKSENIHTCLEAVEVLSLKKNTPMIERIRTCLMSQLENLFSPHHVGIMQAALLGDDSKLDAHTKQLYQKAGISHVLCISGFHVGVIMSVLLILSTQINLPYYIRQLLLVLCIAFYAYLTGLSASTVRASIMVGIVLIGKCLWQEEDRLTNLALAALIILVYKPYQLFMAGFQLSFIAVLAVISCCEMIEKKELIGDWKYPKWQKVAMIWLSVQLATWPIIAYHFYEIALGLALLNLIIIPLFSYLIIGGLLALGISFIWMPLARLLAIVMEWTLSGVEWMISHMATWPGATWCTGRPSINSYVLYSVGVVILWLGLWGYWKKESCYLGGLLLGGFCWVTQLIMPKYLSMTSLYVGQGDSMVMEMPCKELLVIDGGPSGKGKVVENYIKYLGYDHIQSIMVSHSDNDHIGGIIELISSDLSIGQVILSAADESDNLESLLMLCEYRDIPVYRMKKDGVVQYGEVKIECLAPLTKGYQDNLNDCSLVCYLSYNHFRALLTGDKSKDSDRQIYNSLDPVTVLKVSHHGSKTGTSQEMLLKLQPEYAMISCGSHNRFGHPHGEVVKLLDAAGVRISRTDVNGAICYVTDGIYIKETTYRKDA